MVKKILATAVFAAALVGCDLFYVDVTGYLQHWTEYGESLEEDESTDESVDDLSKPVYTITFIKKKLHSGTVKNASEEIVEEIKIDFPAGKIVEVPACSEFTNNDICHGGYAWHDGESWFEAGTLATQSKTYYYIPIDKVLDSSSQLRFSSYIISKGAS